MSLVNVSIVGNIIKPPEQTCYASGKVRTTLIVAIKTPNRIKTGDAQWETDFYRIETWGKLAEVAHKYLAKGSHVGASGRLVLDKWQDRQGRDRVTPIVKADQISLPPPLRVVPADEVLSSGSINPLGGELNFASGDGSEDEFDEALGVASPQSDNDSAKEEGRDDTEVNQQPLLSLQGRRMKAAAGS